MNNLRTTKILGYMGLLGSILVGLGEHLLHYSDDILGNAENYGFFNTVPQHNMSWGHFISVAGLPFYFAGYIHIYQMLRSGNEMFARIVLIIGFIAFAVGGIWIGSRATIGNIVHLEHSINPEAYVKIVDHYTRHLEILVEILRGVIALLSAFFVITIIKGGTFYKKWMAFFNPITILITLTLIGFALPSIGKHILPILMNITHFILFALSIYQLRAFLKPVNDV